MIRWSICIALICSVAVATGEDQPTAEQAIAKAIKILESEREGLKDTFEQAKVDKAIRELEAMISEPDPSAKPAAITFEVTTTALKKKFGGKAMFNAKTSELSLTYDFTGKGQLADFDVGGKKVLTARKTLLVEAGDDLTHIAKFRSFTVNAILTFNEMNGVGIASSNGMLLVSGGQNHDTFSLKVPLSKTATTIVPEFARKGSVPVSLSVTPKKSTAKWANEILAVPAPDLVVQREEPPHQVILKAGAAGCAFGNLTITGAPDPVWFKEFLGE